MKKKIVFLLACILVLPLALYSCGDEPCTVHIDENLDGKCDVCGETVTPEPEPCTEHEDTDGDEKCDRCGEKVEKPKEESKVTAIKSASVLPSATVNLGEEITYTIAVTNTGDSGKRVVLTDTLPDSVSYISGADKVEGRTLKWELSVSSGNIVTVTYKVKVGTAQSLYDTGVINGEAKLDGVAVDSYPIYVRRTIAPTEQVYFRAAMNALNDATFKDYTMLKWIYYVAFSKSAGFSFDAEETLDIIFGSQNSSNEALRGLVIPTLYGGGAVNASKDAGFMGARAAVVLESDFMIGDVLITDVDGAVKMYIYDGGFYDITNGGIVKADTAAVIATVPTAKRFAAFRPSMSALKTVDISEEKPTLADATEYQKMLVKTAEYYILRGERVQYDDSRFASVKKGTDRSEFRWQKGHNAPENYALDRWAYTNCAAFCHDVYLYGLGYEIGQYTTSDMASKMTSKRVFHHSNVLEYTQADRDRIEKEFADTLEIGDLIIVRRKDSSGHVMLYVGGGKVAHSSGSSYSYSTSAETYEPSIRYMDIFDYLFTPGAANNVFEKTNKATNGSSKYVESLHVIRPLKDYTAEIAEESLARIEGLSGIRAEKISSHSRGRSVNVGDEITFTFNFFNSNSVAKTVTVVDKVPANTTFVSVSGGTHDSGNLSFTVELAAGETKSVSYTVCASGTVGSSIYGADAKIMGVSVSCPRIYIKNTLTEAEKTALKTAIKTYAEKTDNTLSGIALVNAIYTEAGLDAPFATTVFEDVAFGVLKSGGTEYDENAVVVSNTGAYRNMLVDGMFGGRYLHTVTLEYLNGTNEGGERIRLIRHHNLETGDVIVARTSSEERVFIYDGELLYNLTSQTVTSEEPDPRLSNLLAYQRYFMVLRPSYKNS